MLGPRPDPIPVAHLRFDASRISLIALLSAHGTWVGNLEVKAGGESARFTLCGRRGGRGRSSLYVEVAELGRLE